MDRIEGPDRKKYKPELVIAIVWTYFDGVIAAYHQLNAFQWH